MVKRTTSAREAAVIDNAQRGFRRIQHKKHYDNLTLWNSVDDGELYRGKIRCRDDGGESGGILLRGGGTLNNEDKAKKIRNR